MTVTVGNGRVRPIVDRQMSTPILGRERERAELAALITGANARLITLVGVGGVGKTSLARQVMLDVAPTFRQGAKLVELASVPDESMVAATVAQTFELGTAGLRSPSEVLQHHLAPCHMLLVLDNFEHVTGASDLIVDLLNAAPNLVVLITSRSPIRIWGEQVVEITPFSVAGLEPDAPREQLLAHPAVRLFWNRAKMAGAALTDADLPMISRICHRLDGLPLAVELAAAQARSLPLDAFVAPLERRLQLLNNGLTDVAPRLRTMEASIDWSYNRLTRTQQRSLQRLSVFTGGFAIEMAEAMLHGRRAGEGYPWSGIYKAPYPALVWWGIDPTVDNLEGVDRGLDYALSLDAIDDDPFACIQALVDQSLIQLTQGRDGTQRYQMLEAIRAFGLARLAESGEAEAARHMHAVIICGFSDTSLGGLWTRLLRYWEAERIDDELGNIRAALAWLLKQGPAAAELALRISNAFNLYWQIRGLISEGIEWFQQVLKLGPGPKWARAEALISLAASCWIQGRDKEAEVALLEAEAIAKEIGMVRTEAQSIFYQALIAWRRGDFELMRRHVDAAFARFGQWQDIIGVGVCHLTYGVLDRKLGRPAEAADHFEDAYKLHDLVAYEWGMATGRYYGGEAARDQGQSTLAAKLQREALNLYWRQGDYWGAGASMGGLAALCAQRGRYFVAAQLFGASDALCRRVGALLPPTELLAYEQIAADVRAHLGEKLYAIAVENGRQSSPEACVALAEAAAAGLLGETLADPWRDEANERTRALAALAGLTLKRRAILKLVAEGGETKEIAHQLKRDYNTIDTQLKAIQKAFDVETKTELIIRIYRTGVYEAL